MKPIKAWAGIVDDKFDFGWNRELNFNDGQYGIYKTQQKAKEHYQEVIRVLITPIKK
jgi:hypothetical protein